MDETFEVGRKVPLEVKERSQLKVQGSGIQDSRFARLDFSKIWYPIHFN